MPLFVVKTKTTCFGNPRSGRLFVAKDKHQAVKTVYCGRRAPRDVEFSSRTPRQWADAGLRPQPLSISGNTLLENDLADAKFGGETQKKTAALWRGPMLHASAVRTQDSEGRAVGSSSVLVLTGIAVSLCMGVSKPTTARSFWRQSLRCVCKTEALRSGRTVSMSCVLLLDSCKR